MDKILKETIRTAKRLQRDGIMYLRDSINIEVEVNYQVIAVIAEDLNILMDEEKYETLKSDKEKLLHEIVVTSFEKDDLIYSFSDDFKMNTIKEFIDLEEPVLIGDTYCFITNYKSLGEIYEKALVQIEEGKFENYIFK